jgi:hypothetical protein
VYFTAASPSGPSLWSIFRMVRPHCFSITVVFSAYQARLSLDFCFVELQGMGIEREWMGLAGVARNCLEISPGRRWKICKCVCRRRWWGRSRGWADGGTKAPCRRRSSQRGCHRPGHNRYSQCLSHGWSRRVRWTKKGLQSMPK